MENEYREREEPKTRYEQQPMDAVRGKNPKVTATVTDEPSGRRKKGQPEPKPAGNEYREKTAETHDNVSLQSGKERSRSAQDATKKKSGPSKRPNLLVQVLNGDILTRDFVLNNLTFIFFILFLLLLVVGKGYYGKQLTKDIDTLQTEVNGTTAEYIENKAKLEESTTRYRLVEALERRGLKESLKPAKVIRIKPKNK